MSPVRMFANFLHPALCPQIESSTVSSEGFELSNLISADEQLLHKGFLAERFISGPVNILLTFTCPVTVKYVIIWPQVGTQKSSGFELSLLNSTNECQRFATCQIPSDKNGLLFHKEGSDIDFSRLSPEVRSFTRSTFFRSRIHENVRVMQVRIFRSHFVPAIRKIEVWGEPHRTCNADTKRRIARLWFKTRRPVDHHRAPESPAEDVEHENQPQLNDAEIPDEFFDEITHELMTLPMILPSGKIIDSRTLDRFQAEEAKWGRLPSDPFTGVLFSECSKPVIATALKSKLDLFLLKYSDMIDLKFVPRRLGSQNEKFNASYFRVSKIVEPEVGKRKLNETDETPRYKNCKISTTVEEISLSTSESDDGISKLLEKTLYNLPSFITSSCNARSDIKCNSCFILVNLYKLPCSHIVCRLCLTKTENQCSDCKKKCSAGEIQKIHLNRLCDEL